MTPPRWRLLVPAGAAVLLTAADTYVVVVVLTSIMGSVGVGVDQLQRATPIITGFLLGYVALLPLLGRLSDRHGPRPVFLGCLVTFAVGSLLTATAHSLTVVIAGRALQGAGGGGLVPVTLSLVAGMWGAEQRGLPLGVVAAVQELGSVLGPLYGAAIVALSGWRAIFWVNLPLVTVLAVAFGVGTGRPARPAGRRDAVGAALALLGAAATVLTLWAPSRLADNVTWGRLYTPQVGGPTWHAITCPLAFIAAGLVVAFLAWEALRPASIHPLIDVRGGRRVVGTLDLPGACLLAVALACVVIAFSTTDPSREVAARSWPVLLPLGVVAVIALVWRERRAADPLVSGSVLRPRRAWGAIVVNFFTGGALMAALIDVPLFARATVDKSSELGAALVLVRFLVAVPVGAAVGGWVCRRLAYAPVAAAGMTIAAIAFVPMTGWGSQALRGWGAFDAELVACGFGFGLAIAPVNAAILAAVRPARHGLASALVVVARMVGMLVGLSVLTAVALHVFYDDQRALGSPVTLCPSHPAHCPAYDAGTNRALLGELHTVFGGAAVAAGMAAVAAVLTLGWIRPGGPRPPGQPRRDQPQASSAP